VLVTPPVPTNTQLLELSVLAGDNPPLLLAKKLEVALVVGSMYGLTAKET
jgi:hypothetical protein